MGSEYDIMLDEKNDKIWALKRELAETNAVVDFILSLFVEDNYSCLSCPLWVDIRGMVTYHDCSKKCHPGKADCHESIKAWALAEARKEQEKA